MSRRQWTWMILTDERRPATVAHGLHIDDADKPIRAANVHDAMKAFLQIVDGAGWTPHRIQFVVEPHAADGANFRAWCAPKEASQ